MEVRSCRSCGKLFNYISGPFTCPACREMLEEKFQQVKKYLYENPGSNVARVAEACEVEPGQIRQWIREERLEFSEGASELKCEKCGTMITSGRFCAQCKAGMVNSLNSAYGSTPKPAAPSVEKKEGGPKMRFLG